MEYAFEAFEITKNYCTACYYYDADKNACEVKIRRGVKASTPSNWVCNEPKEIISKDKD